ncbi:aldose 1-epimerase [Algibacter miyuki]|uniref:Aldose 1-epimerase n=1 Tax=Algibacter miyuki TaxID=1306933 RepID=A0ABV5H3B1_9FLAO|nr:aldose 1-epimerase [Algibacter miyuki]MDN3665463.1 aldose 1-epimerase [Algibacter miyuki]
MYTIKHIENSLEIQNSERSVYAKICLNQGASLQVLKLSNSLLIEDLNPLPYKDTYASSILFPFANRIKDGTYTFEDNIYNFEINEKPNNNALHGLVFDKTFDIVNSEATETSATVELVYNETQQNNGFPYTFSIALEYIFTETTLDLKVKVLNTDVKAFPFTLGWHPYFLSDNLFESALQFESSKKMVFDNRMITSEVIKNPNPSEIEIKDTPLDDCWELDKTHVTFKTPHYTLTIDSSEENSFLQSYTPPKANTIAIEPTTGVSDSFNNKIGLKTLAPNEDYSLIWTLKLD